MRLVPLKLSAGLFSAAVLASVPVAAWLTLGPGLLSETHAASSSPGPRSVSEAAELPAGPSAAGLSAPGEIEPAASASVTLLDAWYYTNHSCASERGRERGKGHAKHSDTAKSPHDCPTNRGRGD